MTKCRIAYVFVAALAVFGWAGAATRVEAQQGQQYPSKPIRMVIGFSAGTITDILTRFISQHLSQALGVAIVVDNKPGADGSIGALDVKRAAPDGYTLMMTSNSAMSVVPHIQKQPPYDPIADFTPITFTGRTTFFIAVHPSVPAKTLTELLAHAKANPGKVTYASGNTTSIVGTALIADHAKVQMLHVPYKSEPPAINDLVSGQVNVMLAAYTSIAPHAKEGKLRVLATTLPQRSALMPDVPSVVEEGLPKQPIGAWGALVGPANLPKEIVQRLNKEVAAIVDRPDLREKFLNYGYAPESSTPEALAAFLKDQLEVWGKTLKQVGIEPQ